MSQAIKVWVTLLGVLVVILFAALIWAVLLGGPGGAGGGGRGGTASPASPSAAASEPAPAQSEAGAPTAEATSASPTEPSPSSSSPEPSASPSPTLAPVPEGAVATATFALPSRNIGCDMTDVAVTCRIAQATFTPPPGEDCEWRGQVVVLDQAGVSLPCPQRAPSVAGTSTTLDYGVTSAVGPWLCTSTREGVECSSRADGTGFLLARATLDSFGPGALG